jgi:hypothetical protein
MNRTTLYKVDDGDRPAFETYDAERAAWYSENGHRVTAHVTAE